MFSLLGRNFQNSLRRSVSIVGHGENKTLAVSLKQSLPATVQACSLATYVHDERNQQSLLYPKPKRWGRYNEIIHKPEDGPVERVNLCLLCLGII